MAGRLARRWQSQDEKSGQAGGHSERDGRSPPPGMRLALAEGLRVTFLPLGGVFCTAGPEALHPKLDIQGVKCQVPRPPEPSARTGVGRKRPSASPPPNLSSFLQTPGHPVEYSVDAQVLQLGNTVNFSALSRGCGPSWTGLRLGREFLPPPSKPLHATLGVQQLWTPSSLGPQERLQEEPWTATCLVWGVTLAQGRAQGIGPSPTHPHASPLPVSQAFSVVGEVSADQ